MLIARDATPANRPRVIYVFFPWSHFFSSVDFQLNILQPITGALARIHIKAAAGL